MSRQIRRAPSFKELSSALCTTDKDKILDEQARLIDEQNQQVAGAIELTPADLHYRGPAVISRLLVEADVELCGFDKGA